jgi:hypothetical protein
MADELEKTYDKAFPGDGAKSAVGTGDHNIERAALGRPFCLPN